MELREIEQRKVRKKYSKVNNKNEREKVKNQGGVKVERVVGVVYNSES